MPTVFDSGRLCAFDTCKRAYKRKVYKKPSIPFIHREDLVPRLFTDKPTVLSSYDIFLECKSGCGRKRTQNAGDYL